MKTQVRCVTVCAGYADYLAQIIPHNRQFLAHWTIVTSPADKRTIQLCIDNKVDCLPTFELDAGGAFFKGKAINRALEKMVHEDWFLLLDADVVLPSDFDRCINDSDLQPGCIYGTNRILIEGWDNWVKLQKLGLACRHNGWLLDFRRWPGVVGGIPARDGEGYVPIGFFQLFHAVDLLGKKGKGNGKRMRETDTSAGGSDMEFALLWPRPQRQFLAELAVFHLQTADQTMGANWGGRKTAEFAPYPTTRL